RPQGSEEPQAEHCKITHGFSSLDFFYRRRYRTFLRHLSAVCDSPLSPSGRTRAGDCVDHRSLGAVGNAALRRRGGISLITLVAAVFAAGAERITLCCHSGPP